MANADLLPMRFSDTAEVIGRYGDELRKLADNMREETAQLRRLLDQNAFKLASDPKETYLPPKQESNVPYFNFAPLDNALAELSKSASRCDKACADSVRRLQPGNHRFARVNELFQQMEQALAGAGLPGRPWYRHMIYAPGLHTGYGVKTLPAVREALEQRRWPEVDQAISLLAEVLNSYRERIDQAAHAAMIP
jgi:N-acetylated-alpha-linked acidic dipeptidase